MFAGIGCGHPPRVRDATMTFSQSNSVVAVSCNRSGETWYLSCRGTEWVGKLGTCSSGSTAHDADDDDVTAVHGWSLFRGASPFPYGTRGRRRALRLDIVLLALMEMTIVSIAIHIQHPFSPKIPLKISGQNKIRTRQPNLACTLIRGHALCL